LARTDRRRAHRPTPATVPVANKPMREIAAEYEIEWAQRRAR